MAVRPEVTSTAQQLQRLSLQDEEVLALLQGLGLSQADTISVLKTALFGQPEPTAPASRPVSVESTVGAVSVLQAIQNLSKQDALSAGNILAAINSLAGQDSAWNANLLAAIKQAQSTTDTDTQTVLAAIQQLSSTLANDIQQLMLAITGPPSTLGVTLSLALLDDGTQQANYVLSITDDTGQAAALLGPEAWSIDNTTDFALTVSADGMSAVVALAATPGPEGHVCNLSVNTPTSTDGSTPPIVDTDVITIVGGAPKTANLTGTVGPTGA